jgi:hypothetical protein
MNQGETVFLPFHLHLRLNLPSSLPDINTVNPVFAENNCCILKKYILRTGTSGIIVKLDAALKGGRI